jgi:SAM-dependent methyltransferase
MSMAQAVIKESITSVGPSGNPEAGISLTSSGGDFYVAKMQNGLEYKIAQEAWSIKTDYYLDTFVHHLSGIIANLQENGNPVKRVLEIGVARGVLSIGIALLTGEDTRIVGIDIEEKAHALVTKNARANGVEHKIEVRIGDLFSPVQAGEKFDLIIAELPIIPVDPAKQQRYIAEGYASEILNISGGADGRDFVDALIVQGAPFLNPGGAIVLIQPSFLGTEVTIQRYAAVGLTGEVLVNKPWRLRDTKFTYNNKDYIAATTGYIYPTNSNGDEIFYLTILKGVK